MSKITRVTHTIFGGSAPAAANGIAQFGSKQAGTPTYTTNIATLQALAAWLNGWGSAVVSGKVPPLEELNAAFLEPSYQIGYLLEMGIPEYDAGTTYYTNSICQSGGQVFTSIVDNNLGNAPASSPTKWILQNPGLLVDGGTIGSESTSTQLNLTISGFPSNANIPNGTVLHIFVGVNRQTIAGNCAISINGGTPISIGAYDDENINSSVTIQLTTHIYFRYNGVIWELLYNPQNDCILSPSSISGTVNDYSPTGFGAQVSFLNMSLSADSTLTGLVGNSGVFPNGGEIILFNNSAHTLNVANQSSSSVAANRFTNYNASNWAIAAGGFAKIRYSRNLGTWLLWV